jgi:hypothetical protein
MPQDHHAHGGLDPQTHLPAPDCQNHHPDSVPDNDSFTNLASKYQQTFVPIASYEQEK